MRWKHLPILITLAVLITAGLAAWLAQPASACVDLQPGRGDAAWFYRTCSSPQPNAAAQWRVELAPGKSGQKSLSVQVENAYPGYQLECDLYFANSGRMPFNVKNITILNANPSDLSLSAVEGSARRGKTLVPCDFLPRWGLNPAQVPLACRSSIHFLLSVGRNVKENIRLPFTVQVQLDEKR
jgi:hypothetical protein